MGLKAARRKHRIRQQELANQLGVNQSMISHWESGRVPLTKEWKLKIQQAIATILRGRIQAQTKQLKTLERSKS